jgi:peroxiredoxin
MISFPMLAAPAIAAGFLVLAGVTAVADEPPLGQKAAEWQLKDWINSEPLTLEGLKGKAVLVRWWMAPGCPYCAATAPALNEFHTRYQERGLVVIGAYHHKAPTPLDLAQVRRSVKELGFSFPVAVDHDWQTLKRWWLDGNKRRWTSVTFLIDRRGVIRHIHPGGQYVRGDKAYEGLKGRIEELLQER